MRKALTIQALWLAVAGVLVGACAGNRAPAPAAEPRRPTAQPVSDGRDARPTRVDCDAWSPESLPASWTYEQRVLPQAENLANDGVGLLRKAEDSALPRPQRESLIEEAVDKLILALKSDPYNVHATYNLAAAYARIGRKQCTLNLLERLVALRKLPSQTAAVDAKADRLLGRGKFKNDMDPDFYDLRGDSDFLRVVNQL